MLFCLSVTLLQVLSFVVTHWDLLLAAAAFLIYSIRATRWGKANAKALEVVASVIENLNHREVKEAVQTKASYLPKAVTDALNDAVRTVDSKQPTPTSAEIIKREALRGLIPEKE